MYMFILTEYCVGGTLNERLHRPSSEEENFKWIRQMAAALAFLHSRSVVHRDLKADNVLLTATEVAKLADFGLAREFIALRQIEVYGGDGSWVTSYERYYMTSGTGPIPWVAPEFFDGHYTEKADVFSLGTLFFAILERDSIMFMGKAIYGAFKNVQGKGKVGNGYACIKIETQSFNSHLVQKDPTLCTEFPSMLCSICTRSAQALLRFITESQTSKEM